MKQVLLILLLLCQLPMFAQKIRVQGTVRGDNKLPIAGAMIYDDATNDICGSTNDDGKFSILVERNATLLFSSVGCKDHREKLRGRMQLDVMLMMEAIALSEVEIVSQVKNKVIPEPTDIEVKGNYFHLRTKFRVPRQMFKSHTRLVVQPTITNLTTKDSRRLKPVVVDGENYIITQNRLYGFNGKADPLHNFVITKDSLYEGEIALYHDSMYVKNPRHDYKADVDISLENYNKIIYIDSAMIARGTVNPLRFFEFDLVSMNLTDEQYLPKPEMQLCEDKGEVRLNFEPSKAEIDPNDPESQRQLRQLQGNLREIEHDPNSTLLSFTIHGIASPDGRHDKNVQLAKSRTENAMKQILSQLSGDSRQYMKLSSSSDVEKWEAVVKLMLADSLPEALKLQEAIAKKAGDPDAQWRAAVSLPFYKKLISAQYLPRLRRVEYTYGYSVFRHLTAGEIREMYNKDYKKLTRHEFYLLIKDAEGEEYEKLCRQALEVYPKFMWVANELSAYLIKNERADVSLLEPFIDKKAPVSVLVNQSIANLQDGNFTKADSLIQLLPDDASLQELKSIVSVLNGNYQLGYDLYAKRGGLNEVLILLAMKRNQEAWDKAQQLPVDNARCLYMKAVAANRLDKVMEAMMALDAAIEMDPSLKELAKVDGDILDLLE